jgi:hypothetical protein
MTTRQTCGCRQRFRCRYIVVGDDPVIRWFPGRDRPGAF